MHVEAEQAVEREVAFAHAIERTRQLAVQCEHQPDGMFGDRIGRVGRHTHHLNAERFGRRQIDIVKAGAAQRDQSRTALRELLETVGTHIVMHENAHDGITARKLGCLAG